MTGEIIPITQVQVGLRGRGIELKEMRDVDGVPRILNLKGSFRASFSAASSYRKGTEDPTLHKASDRAVANTDFPCVSGDPFSGENSAVWYHLC